MKTITISVPEELKKDMKKFKLNWSEVALKALMDKTEKLKRLKNISSRIKLSDTRAQRLADKINLAVSDRFFKEG